MHFGAIHGPKICKSVKVLPTCTKRLCNILMTFFRNADVVHIVSSSSGSGQSQATKYISCIFETKFFINGAIKSATLFSTQFSSVLTVVVWA